ncbi:hypothetical protein YASMINEVIRUS_22 [Yasminevirus sp. GU-2018]|uniref:Uncharacterized protein n=1 Tax=Yasminevirus sp. GU-2018 TaxID=2420051 RepID=A0A5K0U6W3_9VIRU|nr:hypothetical protein YASMINEVIRUS_22 [Yasminevirus sp. GU-2018]
MFRSLLRPVNLHQKYAKHLDSVYRLSLNMKNLADTATHSFKEGPVVFDLARIKSSALILDSQCRTGTFDVNSEIETSLTVANNSAELEKFEHSNGMAEHRLERISLACKLPQLQSLDTTSRAIRASGIVTKYSGIAGGVTLVVPPIAGLLLGVGDDSAQVMLSLTGLLLSSPLYVPLFGICIKAGIIHVGCRMFYNHKLGTLV